MWLACIPASLWASVVSCLSVAISKSDQGIWTHIAPLSSCMLVAFLRTWLGIINLGFYACKSPWPLQQCACIFFSHSSVQRLKSLFCFVLFVTELNVKLKMSVIYLDYSILKQPVWMEKCTQWKVCKINGHLSSLLLTSSFATFPNSFPE